MNLRSHRKMYLVLILVLKLIQSQFAFAQSTWQTFNKGIVGTGSVTAMVFHPEHANEVWLAAKNNGLYLSIDDAKNWNSLHPEIFRLKSITSIVFNPKQINEIFVSTLDDGIFHSNDHGKSWEQMSNLPNKRITSFTLNKLFPQEMYLTTLNQGVYKSKDSGQTWIRIDNGIPKQFEYGSIAINPLNPNHLMLFTLEDSGFQGQTYQSLNGGASWTLLQAKDSYRFAFSPINPQQIYVPGTGGLYESHDLGRTFNLIFSEKGFITAILVNSNNPKQLFVAIEGAGLFKTNDSGKSWQLVNSDYKNDEWTKLLLNGNSLFLTTDNSGLFRTQDDGTNWQSVEIGLTNINTTIIAINPQNPQQAFAGTDGNGLWRMTDGETWVPVDQFAKQHIVNIIYDPTNPAHIVLNVNEVLTNIYSHIYVSEDNGQSWTKAKVEAQKPEEFIPVNISFQPNQSKHIYAVGEYADVWNSLDGGYTWSLLSNLTAKQDDVVVGANVITFDTKNPNQMYAGANDLYGYTLFKSEDAGQTWIQMPYRFLQKDKKDDDFNRLQAIAVDPLDSKIIYAGSRNHFYVSHDAGKTWTLSDAGLPKINVISSIVIDPANTKTIFISTNDSFFHFGYGVFVSRDGGLTWNDFNQGLQNLAVESLTLHQQSLYASTSGPGIFVRKI